MPLAIQRRWMDENTREAIEMARSFGASWQTVGLETDVTHSLEGIGVTEAGRPRGWLLSHRRQRGPRLRAQFLAAPALIQPPNLLLSSRRTFSTLVGWVHATTCSLPPRSLPGSATVPCVNLSLSLSLSLSFLPRRVHVYFFIIFRLYSTLFLQYLQNSDLYLTFSREFFIFERCHNFPCLRWTRRFGIFYIVYVCTLKMLWLRRMCVSQKKIKRRKWRISFM